MRKTTKSNKMAKIRKTQRGGERYENKGDKNPHVPVLEDILKLRTDLSKRKEEDWKNNR